MIQAKGHMMQKNSKQLILLAMILWILYLGASLFAQIDDQIMTFDASLFSGLKYRYVGPSRGGRVTAVAGIASQPSTFYMGATGGGVWKTTDYGQTWFNVSDGYFETPSIGAIRVAQNNPDIVYVGTGSDGIRSNVITGRGIYKSVDAGKTWQMSGLRNTGQIGAVEIHPENADVVFVAAIGHPFGPNPERGVYKTRDGGKSWTKVFFISDSTGAVDLEFAPDNPNEIYAGMWRGERKPWTIISGSRNEGGLYKSTDGGESWRKLTNGLPGGIFGKSDLAVSPADPNRVYVLIEAPVGEGGVYRSDDRGESFRLISTRASLLDRPFYYCNIDADPTNADILYVNSTGYFKSTDAGETWQRRSTPHGDNHDQWMNPDNPDIYVQGNDGGVNVTRDGGETWSTQYNQPTAELYQVNVDDQFPYWLYAGQQDNSTIMVPSIPPYSPAAGHTHFWRAIGGCETGPAVPKPGNHNIVYANCKGRFGRYNKLTGQEKQYYVGASNMYGHNPRDLKYRFQRVSPIHVSPHDPDVVYHASQYLHKTTDDGVTWETISPDLTAFEPDKQVISGSPVTRDITGEEFYSTIYAVQESPLQKGLIWVGANDGPIHVTLNGGKNWTNVTPEDLPSGGRVQTIEASPHNPAKAYVAVYRYLLDDWQPYIFRTDDYGDTWTRLTTGKNGIPSDYPTRAVREDPDREGLLYAGTEFGMYISFDDGRSWQDFQHNLPRTPVTDIKIYRKDLVISTMGRGFWIMDNLTPLHQLKSELADADYHLYGPKKAIRIRYRSYGRNPDDPEYPPPGAAIDYYLAEKIEKEIKLEILNEAGKVIRSFSNSNEKHEDKWPTPGLEDKIDSMTSMGTPLLSIEPGMHRLIWDLSYQGPWHAAQNRAGRNGPMVPPGMYQARLTIGKWSHTERFEVCMDPRIVDDGVTQIDIKAQVDLGRKVQHLLSRGRIAATHLQSAREKIKGNVGKNDRQAVSLDKKLAALESRLVTADGRYPQPMLVDQISYLNSMLNRADQKPGRDAYVRYDELKSALSKCILELKKILE